MEAEKKDKSKILTIICTVVLLAVMFYLFHDVLTTNFNKYETVTTEEIVYQDTVDLKAFVVRDEAYIDGSSSGTVVPLVADGKRVARGDAVARVCKSDEDAADFAALENAKAERERYIALSNRTDINTVDMEKLNGKINKSYAQLMQSVSTDDYGTLSENIEELEDELAGKQILMDGTVDFSKKITAIDKTISQLEAKKINPSEVVAPVSGYYISTMDGFENTVDYENVDKLSVSDVDKALKAQPVKINDKMGKIVESYKWYIASTIDSKYTKTISEGDRMKINIPFYGLKGIAVTVEKLSPEQNGRVAVILSCNLMNETYANMRNVDVQLVIKEYNGFKVPGNAIRSVKTDDGRTVEVVYILRGDYMSARAVEILFTPRDEDYVIVSSSSENVLEPKEKSVIYYAIKRYDEVIVKGRNLENGKSIG